MAFSLRSLLARVALFRPDKDEAVHLFALQEAARSLYRYTQLATEILPVTSVAAGVAAYAVASSTPTTRDLIRVERITYAPVPPTATYIGTFDGGSVPSLNTTYGAFYICATAGGGYAIGDVIWSNGTAWQTIKVTEFVAGVEDSKPRIQAVYSSPQSGKGTPAHWAQEDGTVFFYPPLSCDYPIQIELSYVPIGEFDTVDFPREAEDVIVAGALEFLLNLPGEGANFNRAMIEGKKFYAGRDNLRSLHYVGFGGDFVQTPPSFTGRNNPAGPYTLSPRYL